MTPGEGRMNGTRVVRGGVPGYIEGMGPEGGNDAWKGRGA